ncbi:hypothetical protein KW799_01090 [Candidatus Parcubacteria bacterium]|nr:hypothetical protein [Candidatus Parcubacteria bacterium]
MNRIGIAAGLISLFGVALGLITAWFCKDSFATWGQMLARGFSYGIPWLYHFGMWGDATIMTFIIVKVTSRFWLVWKLGPCLAWAAVSIVIGFAACWLYDKSTIPESHTIGGTRTVTGWVHLFYTSYAIWFILMFYFSTPHELIPPSFACWMSFGLTFHVFVGTHSVLKLWDPARFGFKPFSVADLGPTGAVATATAGLAYYIVRFR